MRVEKSSDFSEVIKHFPLAIFEVNRGLDVIFLNEKAKSIIDYTDEDIDRGLNAFDIFVSEEHEEVKENIRKIATGAEYQYFEQTVRKKDGTKFPVN